MKKMWALFVAVTLWVAGTSGVAIAADDADRMAAAARLNELMEAYFEERLAMYPLFATSIGDHRYDDRYTVTIAPEFRAAEAAVHRRYLQDMRAVDPDLLDDEGRASRELFIWDRTMDIEGFAFPSDLMPMNQFWSAANSFVQLGSGTSYQPFVTVEDYDNWLSRMDGFVAWVDQAIVNMQGGMEQGVVLPRILVEKMIPQVGSQVVDAAEKSVFSRPVENMPGDFSPEDRARLTAAYRTAISTRLIPAYARLGEFLENDYLPAARETVGYGALPGGEEWYAYLVRLRTTTDLSPAEIHAIGLAEVARIHDEMRDVMRAVGFEGSLQEFFDFMETDPRFYFEQPEQLLDGYRALKGPVEQGTRPLFYRYPTLDFEIRPIESFREKSAAGGQYRWPDPDGTRPGVFFVNTYDLSARPSWAMEALYLHEAVPGHHFQNALRIETGSLPRYRRFLSYTVYSEGWALYAETLGHDIGMYRDPYQYFGALSSELWRAIRLVVDTGIHAMGWTRHQVLDYMHANAAVGDAKAVSEAERYMAVPGQALAYKVGQLKITELRERATHALGDDFDIRDFHAMVLDAGPQPLVVLEQRVDQWISEAAASAPTER